MHARQTRELLALLGEQRPLAGAAAPPADAERAAFAAGAGAPVAEGAAESEYEYE